MKKIKFMKSQFKIMVASIIGLLCLLILNGVLYEQNMYNSVQNVTDLTTISIKSELDKMVEITMGASINMAYDYTLNDYLRKCHNGKNTQNDWINMKGCLQNYKRNRDFSTVFLIDAESLDYYTTEGVHRVLHREDAEDDWYFNFIDSDDDYTFDVDNDQANSNTITVFVDYKMYDSEGKVVGVTGAGFIINNMQEILKEYEDQYQLKLYIVDEQGNLQISREHSDQSEDQELAYKRVAPREYKSFSFTNRNKFVRDLGNYYMVIRKLDHIEWYLVVAKTKGNLRQQFYIQIILQAAISIILLTIYMVVVDRLVKQHNLQIIKIMNTDDLTNLPNRRAFEAEFRKRQQQEHPKDGVLFLFDIDNFKGINDSKGHLGGDDSLAFVSYMCRKYITEENGIIARWGGDEFVGMIYMDLETTAFLLGKMQKEIQDAAHTKEDVITISIGMTPLRDAYLNDMLTEVDEALYKAKKNGKNQLVIWEKE